MADQDFNIKVVTTADTTGLKQVGEQMDAIARRQAEAEAKWARSPINPRNQVGGGGGIASLGSSATPATPVGDSDAGLRGTSIGLGTIVTLLTVSLNKWKEFNAEQDRWVEGMIKSQEHSRALGLEVADMLDAMKSAERIDTEPLQVSFDRLKQKVGELKTEMRIAFGAGEYEDVKKIASALGVVESQLNRVTNAIERKAEADQKASESFLKNATDSSSSLTQQVLKNEELTKKAIASGRPEEADALKRGTALLKEGMTTAELQELQSIQKGGQKPAIARPPQPGEPGGGEVGSGGPSLKGDAAAQARQAEIENTKKAGEAAQKEREESNKRLMQEQRAGEIEKQTKGQSPDVVTAINLLLQKFDQYWS